MKRLISALCVFIFLISCNDASFEGESAKNGIRQSPIEIESESNDIVTANPSDTVQQTDPVLKPQPNNSVSTRTITYWKSDDYVCVNKRNIVETLSIEQQGNLLIARKIQGDECIGNNEISWRARYSDETGIGPGIIYGRHPGTTQINKTEMTIKIISKNHIQLIFQGEGPMEFYFFKEALN